MSPPTGQLLDGRYLVESRLAQGGMATVYLGRDVRLDRVVALKIAHAELAGDHEFVRRFITEARAAAQLSSPNVVAVFDQGSVGDINYIAMEYVPGETLRGLLRAHGALTVRGALDIIEGVLSGLGAAHRAGIIHRDVKPENVLLGRDGVIKVADFGLARAAAAVSRTATGMIIGTAAYLAPEQVSASSSDSRTDVYAAGVMLFEMLTGAQPHTGDSPLDVAYKHVSDVVPPPSTLMPGLPPALDALVALATSRDPDLRPADAGQFLQAVTEVRQVALPPAPRRGQHAAPAGADSWPGGGSLEDTDLGPAVGGAAGYDSGAYASGGYSQPGAPYSGWDSQRADEPSRPFGRHSGDGQDSANHTLVVSAGALLPGFGGPGDEPPRDRRLLAPQERWEREPVLQRMLFSRRLFYLLGGLAVVLAGVLAVWWLTAGRYTIVPRLAGQTASAAGAELRTRHLSLSDAPGQHSNLPRGEIISTSPAAGAKIRTGATVTITVSLGPVMVQVPGVTGQPLAQAESALHSAGLIPGRPRSVTSATIPAGVVISTDPIAGTSWPKDKPVGITVSAGPPLPDFVGQQLAVAQQAAGAGGYHLNQVTVAKSSAPANTIIRQSPPAGSAISAGEVVTVYISPGPPSATVPDVTGEPANQAIAALEAAGFKVSVQKHGVGNIVTGYGPSGTQPKGTTITIAVGFSFF